MTRTVYGPPVGLAVRGIGVGAVVLGLITVGLSVVLAADLPAWLYVTLLALLALAGAAAVLVLVVGVLRVYGRGVRLVLDDEGFLNATGYGLGPRRGAWRDVRKVQADGPIVSVDLAGGKQSLIRTSAIDVDPRELARELRSRLNTNRGYRPLADPQRHD